MALLAGPRLVTNNNKRQKNRKTYSEFLRAGPDTGSVVLEEVLGTLLDAGGAVGVLALGVPLPPVAHGVVDMHGGTLLLANPVIVEVLARLKKIESIAKILH